MARIYVIYDPNDRVKPMTDEQEKARGISQALLELPAFETPDDVKNAATKLVEMLMEKVMKVP